MKIKAKIANRQLAFILFMMRTTVTIALLPVLTTADAAQDAWLAAIATFIGSALMLIAISALGVRYPDQTLVQYGAKLVSSWPAKVISLVILSALLVIAATDVRIYGEMLITGFLVQTPLVFITAGMVFAAAVAAWQGIEVIARVAGALFPVFLLMLTLSLTMVLPLVELKNLQPVLARGLMPVIKGSITPTAIAAQMLVLTILIPALEKPRRATGTALWALLGSSLVLVLITIVTVGILGSDQANRSIFPFYVMVRSIEVTEFIQRIEALPVFAWGFGLFVGIATALYCLAQGLAQVLGLSDYRPLVFPLATIQTVFSVQAYKDVFELLSFFKPNIIAPYVLTWFVLSLVPLWVAHTIRQLFVQKGED
ncbi:MAG TPA: endospore germination permease [bacterium]|jgi:spore germination protein KB|nr:endospore germination permease [bacterium]